MVRDPKAQKKRGQTMKMKLGIFFTVITSLTAFAKPVSIEISGQPAKNIFLGILSGANSGNRNYNVDGAMGQQVAEGPNMVCRTLTQELKKAGNFYKIPADKFSCKYGDQE
jgi:hypothetical protein